MKSHVLPLAVSLLASVSAYAGSQVEQISSKDKIIAPTYCFNEHEWQFDIYGAYSDGNGHDHAGPLQDHGWGGGVGVNYFITRMIGIGVDGTALYGRENPQNDGNGHLESGKHTTTYGFTGSVIVRFPIDSACLAPYVYAGGGFHTDGDEWASAHAGVGIEYRVVPNKIGLFLDGRYTYYGDRYGNGDQGNALAKAGVRIVF